MSQQIFDDINPSATSGSQLATTLNLFKDAIASGFSGTSRPTNLQAGGYWIDTTNNPTSWAYKIYTGAMDLTVMTFNLVSGTVSLAGVDGQFSLSKSSDDAVGPIINMIKKRVSGGGQTLIGDILGELDFNSTDDGGTQRVSAKLKAISTDNTTSSEFGAYVVWEVVNTDGTSLTEKMRLQNGKIGVGVGAEPSFDIHAKGTLGVGSENQSDTTTGALITFRKKRSTGVGQVQSGDSLGTMSAKSTDNAGAVINDAFVMDIVALENHTTTAQGTKVDVKVKAATTTTLTTVFSILSTGISSVLGAVFKHLILGTNATATTNVKVYRSGTGKLSIVLGGDSTAEGTDPTVLAQLGHRMETFTSGTKPANNASNVGRVIFVSDTNKFEYDTGSAWAGLGGGSLVVSSQTTLTAGATIAISGTDSRRKINVKANAALGDIDLAGIANGVTDGDELYLEGQSDTDSVWLRKGIASVILNGDWAARDGSMIGFVWNSTRVKWVENFRNQI